MADLLFPDNGLAYWFTNGLYSGVNYHLRTNNYVVTLSDTLGVYTECSLSGYAAISVSVGDWIAGAVTAHLLTMTAPAITFTAVSGSATVYGYYVTDPTNTYLLATCTYDSPITFSATAPLQVIPVVGNFSEYSS